MRRYGERPDPTRSYRDRPGAYAIILGTKGQLLTIERRPGYEIDIALPGGGIDPGESTIPALHREVMEETGWKIAVTRRVTTYQRFCYMPEYDLWARKVCHIYLCRAVMELSPPLDPFHTPIWASPDIATEMISNPADGKMLAAFLQS